MGKEPGGLQSMGSQRDGHDRVTDTRDTCPGMAMSLRPALCVWSACSLFRSSGSWLCILAQGPSSTRDRKEPRLRFVLAA